MRSPSKLLVLLLLLGPVAGAAKDTTMIFVCSSLRLLPATVRQLGFDHRLSFTTTDDGTINDELHVALDDSPTQRSHVSGLRLLLPPDPVFPDQPDVFEAELAIDVPDVADANFNGISDLLEVSQATAPVATTGEIVHDDGMEVVSGTVAAIWSKAAGSTTGLCKLRVKIPDLAFDQTFNHTFEIFDYRGTLAYTSSGTNVDATVALRRQGADGAFSGPLKLGVIDRDELGYGGAAWTGPGGLRFDVLGTDDPLGGGFTALRGGLFTNYFGLVYFADGDPATPFADEYDLWHFDIRDGNDADNDGIPDLSDVAGDGVDLTGPQVVLRTLPGGLVLRVAGKSGQKIATEQRPGLAPSDWELVDVRTLAADAEDVDLPLPAEGTRFYRVRVL